MGLRSLCLYARLLQLLLPPPDRLQLLPFFARLLLVFRQHDEGLGPAAGREVHGNRVAEAAGGAIARVEAATYVDGSLVRVAAGAVHGNGLDLVDLLAVLFFPGVTGMEVEGLGLADGGDGAPGVVVHQIRARDGQLHNAVAVRAVGELGVGMQVHRHLEMEGVARPHDAARRVFIRWPRVFHRPFEHVEQSREPPPPPDNLPLGARLLLRQGPGVLVQQDRGLAAAAARQALVVLLRVEPDMGIVGLSKDKITFFVVARHLLSRRATLSACSRLCEGDLG